MKSDIIADVDFLHATKAFQNGGNEDQLIKRLSVLAHTRQNTTARKNIGGR